MAFRIFSAYVKNTLISGLFFLPIVLLSSRKWLIDDTIAFVLLGWFLGWMISALFKAAKIITRGAASVILKDDR
jgi:hypothetical protein